MSTSGLKAVYIKASASVCGAPGLRHVLGTCTWPIIGCVNKTLFSKVTLSESGTSKKQNMHFYLISEKSNLKKKMKGRKKRRLSSSELQSAWTCLSVLLLRLRRVSLCRTAAVRDDLTIIHQQVVSLWLTSAPLFCSCAACRCLSGNGHTWRKQVAQ